MDFCLLLNKLLSNMYSQRLIDTAKISTADAIKTDSKRALQKSVFQKSYHKMLQKTLTLKQMKWRHQKKDTYIQKKKYWWINISIIYNNRKSKNNKFIGQYIKSTVKNLTEINDQVRGNYNIDGNIRFKATILKPMFCDYSDAYICVKGRIRLSGERGDIAARQAD